MTINFLSFLELLARALPALAQVTVAVLHATGADKHKTIAGEVAGSLVVAGAGATLLHNQLMNGVQPGAPPPGVSPNP